MSKYLNSQSLSVEKAPRTADINWKNYAFSSNARVIRGIWAISIMVCLHGMLCMAQDKI